MRGPVGIWTRSTQRQQTHRARANRHTGEDKDVVGERTAQEGCTGREQREVGEQHNPSTLG